MDLPIKSKCPTLHQEGIFLLKRLVKLKSKIPRRLLGHNEFFTNIYCSGDGSKEIFGAFAHGLMEGTSEARLIRATNKAGAATIPSQELNAAYLACKLLHQLIIHFNLVMPREEMEKLEFFVVFDSLPTGQQLVGSANQKNHQRLVEKVHKELGLVERCLQELKLDK